MGERRSGRATRSFPASQHKTTASFCPLHKKSALLHSFPVGTRKTLFGGNWGMTRGPDRPIVTSQHSVKYLPKPNKESRVRSAGCLGNTRAGGRNSEFRSEGLSDFRLEFLQLLNGSEGLRWVLCHQMNNIVVADAVLSK